MNKRQLKPLLPEELAERASDLEEEFLGTLLLEAPYATGPHSLWGLAGHDFYYERWGMVFEAIKTLMQEGRMTYTNLCHLLEDRGQMAEIGNRSEITRLITRAQPGVQLPGLANGILDISGRHAILLAGEQAMQLALLPEGSRRAIEEAQHILEEARSRQENDDSFILYSDQQQEFAYQEMQKRERDAANPKLLIDTPWPTVNRFIGSLRPGHLFIIAGYPGHGKSVCFEQIAEHNARRGFQVAFFHLEHTNWWMTARRTMRLTGAHVYAQERGEDMEETLKAAQEVSEWIGGIHYVHCPGWTSTRIAQLMRELHEQGKCDLAIVDYLQKVMLSSRDGWNQSSLIGDTVEILKTAGEELAIPLLLGSQLNRAGQERPHLNNLRSSGEIEEKANHVFFIWRERMVNNRLSLTGLFYQEKPFDATVPIYFDAPKLTFIEQANGNGAKVKQC